MKRNGIQEELEGRWEGRNDLIKYKNKIHKDPLYSVSHTDFQKSDIFQVCFQFSRTAAQNLKSSPLQWPRKADFFEITILQRNTCEHRSENSSNLRDSLVFTPIIVTCKRERVQLLPHHSPTLLCRFGLYPCLNCVL